MPHKHKDLAPKLDINTWNESNKQIYQRLDEMASSLADLHSRVEFVEAALLNQGALPVPPGLGQESDIDGLSSRVDHLEKVFLSIDFDDIDKRTGKHPRQAETRRVTQPEQELSPELFDAIGDPALVKEHAHIRRDLRPSLQAVVGSNVLEELNGISSVSEAHACTQEGRAAATEDSSEQALAENIGTELGVDAYHEPDRDTQASTAPLSDEDPIIATLAPPHQAFARYMTRVIRDMR